jgi:hypothetical protein
MPVNDSYYQKYLKYKTKYLDLKSQLGGDTVKQHTWEDFKKSEFYTKGIYHDKRENKMFMKKE